MSSLYVRIRDRRWIGRNRGGPGCRSIPRQPHSKKLASSILDVASPQSFDLVRASLKEVSYLKPKPMSVLDLMAFSAGRHRPEALVEDLTGGFKAQLII